MRTAEAADPEADGSSEVAVGEWRQRGANMVWGANPSAAALSVCEACGRGMGVRGGWDFYTWYEVRNFLLTLVENTEVQLAKATGSYPRSTAGFQLLHVEGGCRLLPTRKPAVWDGFRLPRSKNWLGSCPKQGLSFDVSL